MKKLLTISIATLFCASFAYAQTTTVASDLAITSAFQKYKDISALFIKVPTAVEVPIMEEFANRFNFAVLDTGTNTFQPYYFKEKLRSARLPITIVGQSDSGKAMLDEDMDTFTEFPLPENEQGQVSLVLKSEKSMTLDGMSFFFDRYVSLPTSVEVRAMTADGEKIMLAKSKMDCGCVVFPKTTAKEWTVSFTYGQMLRITEIVLDDETAGVASARALRFLAQPQHSYRVYFDADRSVFMSVGEAGNLASDVDVMKLPSIETQTNAGYVLADSDGDSIPDIKDNCVLAPNADQVDVNGNGRGDACDDFDRDGIVNNTDNCPNDPNYNQADVDADKIGDTCDKEESRITEKYPWLPWAGMGFAGLVLLVLFVATARGMMKKEE